MQKRATTPRQKISSAATIRTRVIPRKVVE